MRLLLAALLLFPLAVGCGDDPTPIAPPPPVEEPTPVGPELATDLRSGLFDWPARDFSFDNRAPLALTLGKGDLAVDFTLSDLDGEEVTLSELLATRPVLLLLGSYSCPAYHDAIESFNQMVGHSIGDQPLEESVHVVHVYVVEAHPKAPDMSPHYGAVLEAQFSDDLNARTYDQRRAAAARIAPKIPAGQHLLLDDLTPHGADNPVWCTYGTGASSAFLIRMDGIIAESQLWANAGTMENAVRRVLVSDGI